MAYTPTVWQAGDTVTVSKLNKMEQGIAGTEQRVASLEQGAGNSNSSGVFMISNNHSEDDSNTYDTLSETFETIWNNISNGALGVIKEISAMVDGQEIDMTYHFVYRLARYDDENDFIVGCDMGEFFTNSYTGYPQITSPKANPTR